MTRRIEQAGCKRAAHDTARWIARQLSALSALALVAAPVHSGNAKIGMRIDRWRSAIMEIVERFRVVIQLPGMRIRRRPAWTLPHALVLRFKQGPHPFGDLLGSARLPA